MFWIQGYLKSPQPAAGKVELSDSLLAYGRDLSERRDQMTQATQLTH